MGSRIMHYCISSLIADKLEIEHKSEFMLGGIAPDIHGLMSVAKGVTHFKDLDARGKSHINIMRFYETYKDVIHEPFYLGYLCHLVSDVVWLDVYFEIVEYVSPEQWVEKLNIAYGDFGKLNRRIIDHYSLRLQHHEIPIISICNYNVDFLPTLVELLGDDFSSNEEFKQEPLELFNNDNSQIHDYISRSVTQCIDTLTNLNIIDTLNSIHPENPKIKLINKR